MDIVAYMYKADIHCVDCYKSIVDAISEHSPGNVPQDIYNEHTFDSDDYPKVIFDPIEQSYQEHCGSCGEEIDTVIIHQDGDDSCQCDDCTDGQ